MREPARNILLLVICCLWIPTVPARVRCPELTYQLSCAGGNNKRADINGLAPSTYLGTVGGGSDTQQDRVVERRGGGTGLREAIKVDGLRSESSYLRQMLEKQLLDIANRRHSSPSDSLEEEQNLERRRMEEPVRPGNTDTDERYSIKDTLTMLRKIMGDIESKLDSQSASDSVGETRG